MASCSRNSSIRCDFNSRKGGLPRTPTRICRGRSHGREWLRWYSLVRLGRYAYGQGRDVRPSLRSSTTSVEKRTVQSASSRKSANNGSAKHSPRRSTPSRRSNSTDWRGYFSMRTVARSTFRVLLRRSRWATATTKARFSSTCASRICLNAFAWLKTAETSHLYRGITFSTGGAKSESVIRRKAFGFLEASVANSRVHTVVMKWSTSG